MPSRTHKNVKMVVRRAFSRLVKISGRGCIQGVDNSRLNRPCDIGVDAQLWCLKWSVRGGLGLGRPKRAAGRWRQRVFSIISCRRMAQHSLEVPKTRPNIVCFAVCLRHLGSVRGCTLPGTRFICLDALARGFQHGPNMGQHEGTTIFVIFFYSSSFPPSPTRWRHEE